MMRPLKWRDWESRSINYSRGCKSWLSPLKEDHKDYKAVIKLHNNNRYFTAGRQHSTNDTARHALFSTHYTWYHLSFSNIIFLHWLTKSNITRYAVAVLQYYQVYTAAALLAKLVSLINYSSLDSCRIWHFLLKCKLHSMWFNWYW